jgi:transposase
MEGSVKEHHRFLLLQHMALIEILEEHIAEFDQKIAERIEQDEEEQETTQPRSSQEQSEAKMEASSPSVVRRGLEGYAKALARLEGIPGINRRVAEIVLAEIGITMEQFPSDGHLASWAGMCPGSKVSAGKRFSGKTTKGSAWLRAALLEAAHGASHRKQSYLGEQ